MYIHGTYHRMCSTCKNHCTLHQTKYAIAPTVNCFEFNVENNSRLAWTVNNEHRKFFLKCISQVSYSKLKPFVTNISFHSLSDFTEGKNDNLLEIKPIYGS